MLFNSWSYAVFLPLVFLGYFFLAHRLRWVWMLAASCIFYMAFVPKYILILFAVIFIDYVAAIAIESAQGRRRKVYLIVGLVANLGILGFFKYFDFFAINVNDVLSLWGSHASIPLLSIMLPIGLSFHTFQSMSYTIEVWRGQQVAERHLGYYALYVLFFPQMVAGPIERPQNLIHQFKEPKVFDYARLCSGLQLFLVGLLKKVLIADRVAVFVNAVYENPHAHPGPTLLMATYLFSFQVYCDFSGYTDMARGSARIFGIELMENFDRPYWATSIGEFWRRWHMSLMTWFRDYLYQPFVFSGSRSVKRVYFAILLVFSLSGLWHGASWTFIIWGLLHGVYSILSALSARWRKKFTKRSGLAQWPLVRHSWGIFVTFNFVTFTYIFFRSKSLADALFIVRNLTKGWTNAVTWTFEKTGLPAREVMFSLVLIALLEWLQFLHSKEPMGRRLAAKPLVFRWLVFCTALMGLVIFGQSHVQQFIYFQF